MINGGAPIQYFKLEKSARQGDVVSTYWFLLCLEFTLVKNNKDIKSLNILGNTFLYTTYAGNTKELQNTISLFSSLSGLKPNLSKREVSRIGGLKGVGVKVTVCGIKGIYLSKDVIKIL